MIGDHKHNYVHIAALPDTNSKVYPPQFNISYKLNHKAPYLKYLKSSTSSDYEGSIMNSSIAIIFTLMALIMISIVGAYYSNKYCTKSKFSKVTGEYLTAGEIPKD